MPSEHIPLLITTATPALAAAVAAYGVRRMARTIRAAQVDPADEEAVHRALHDMGYCATVIFALADTARLVALHSEQRQ